MKRFFWFHVLGSMSYCLIFGHLLLLWIGPRYTPGNKRKIRTSSFLCFHQQHLIQLTGSSEQMALKWFVHCFITLCVQFHCSIKISLRHDPGKKTINHASSQKTFPCNHQNPICLSGWLQKQTKISCNPFPISCSVFLVILVVLPLHSLSLSTSNKASGRQGAPAGDWRGQCAGRQAPASRRTELERTWSLGWA